MSPLAGPVAAAAVIFASGTRIPEVDDSKRLTPEVRERLAPVIRERALAWAVAYAEVDEIDCINIYWAGLAAMRRAIEALAPAAEHLLIDGRRAARRRRCRSRASSRATPRACRSRRRRSSPRRRATRACAALDDVYPGYGFAQHKGYPVKAHFRALRRLGACPIHRRSFAVVREVLGLPPLPPWPARSGVAPASSPRSRPRATQAGKRRRRRRRQHDRPDASSARTHTPAHADTPPHPTRTRQPMSRNLRRKLRRRAFPPSTTLSIA